MVFLPCASEGLGSVTHTQASSLSHTQQHKPLASSENSNTSIYVAGLSPDLTERDLGGDD
jgi:hypothetical protein